MMTDPRIAALADALHEYVPGRPVCDCPERAAAILAELEAGPDYTDLLLLIADCLVTLAWKAERDAGARQSRLYAIRGALGAER